MKRKITVFACILAGLFVTWFGYANLRFVNPSAQLEPIHARTFALDGLNASDAGDYKAYLRSSNCVRAISLDTDHNTLGLTYYHKAIAENELIRLLSWDGKIKAQPKDMTTSAPQCPVQGVAVLWERATASLRVIR